MGRGDYLRLGVHGLTEEAHGLDVRELRRRGFLDAGRLATGTWRWLRGERETAAVGVTGTALGVGLAYRFRQGNGPWQDVRQALPLEWTPCHFGGRRPWFVCPCGRRVAIVYATGPAYRCRVCADLRYRCQRESAGALALQRIQQLRHRLGGSGNLLEPFPRRPEGMHRRTYERLRRRERELDAVRAAELAGWLARLGGRRP